MRRALLQRTLLILFVVLFCGHCIAQEGESVDARFTSITQIDSIKKLKDTDNGTLYEVMFTQPIDHQNPWKGTFTQRMFLTHKGFDSPMLMITDGYSVTRSVPYELARHMGANQLYIEHRYFAASTPEEVDWDYLTIEQSAQDHHAIREAFGKLYGNKWVSTGISKGGQTALYYKYFYPQDVTATVAYVAPIALAQEDERIWPFINSVGDADCREKIAAFQRRVLENRDEMVAMMQKFIEGVNQEFLLGAEVTLEIIVAEYPFSFWQFYREGNCDQIPGENATAKELYDHLRKIVPVFLYTKASYTGLKPAFYQFVTQIGYYGFDVDHLGDLIKHKDKLDNRYFAPDDVELKFDGTLVNDVHDFLLHRAQNVVYVYGGVDTWSACAVEPLASTNSFAVFAENGNHGSRIATLNDEQKTRVFDALEGWLGFELKRDLEN